MKRLTLLLIGLCFVSILFLPGAAEAASPNISHSFQTSNALAAGGLVSLVSANSNLVEEANISNAQRLVGVVVASNQSLVAVNTSSGNVQVATDGVVNTLVSNVNGN